MKKRQNASTSLVQRERICVQRIQAHAFEMLTLHDSLGYPQRGIQERDELGCRLEAPCRQTVIITWHVPWCPQQASTYPITPFPQQKRGASPFS